MAEKRLKRVAWAGLALMALLIVGDWSICRWIEGGVYLNATPEAAAARDRTIRWLAAHPEATTQPATRPALGVHRDSPGRMVPD